MKMQGTQNTQNNLEKGQMWKTDTSWFQNLLQSNINQDCGIIMRIDQENRIETSEINHGLYDQLIFNKDAQDHSMWKE